ncbi:MAG: transcription elongation factor GreA [Proteobacteria bacterium]|nr:MAG: transcription elongation factor GreA [Pseudomonadota bacterium]
MNDAKVFPVTVEGKQALEEELKRLVSVERPIVIQMIETARAHGDLKENAEYHAAKEKQSFMEGRIQHINAVIAGAQVIDIKTLNYPHVVFGAIVDLEDSETGTEVTYQIVGIDEADIQKNKISIASPIARALIGKKKGDEVKVVTPKGGISYEVRGVRYGA